MQPPKLAKPQREKQTLMLTALCAVGMFCVLYAVLGVWPFGSNSVATGDLHGLYLRYFAGFRQAVLSGESIAYSFSKALGGSMLGVLAYYCNSPFNVLYLLVPSAYYAGLAGVVLALKCTAAAVFMAFFLGRRHTGLGLRAAPLALCYAFCMYAIVFSQNIMWHDTLLLTPLVCWGICRLVDTGKPYVFALTLGLAIVTDFYIAYMLCLFSVLYFGYEMLLATLFWQTDMTQPAPKARADGRGSFWLRRSGAFAFGAVCGGGLAGALLLPALGELSATKGMPTSFALTGKASFKLAEFFHRLLPGSFAWEDMMDGLPHVYCGTLVVVLVLLYFCARGISCKEKLLSGAFLAVMFLSLYGYDFYLLWHGLTKPIWFPYRNAFLFVFLMVFFAGGALARARLSRVGGLCVLGAGGLLLAVCFLVRHKWFTMTRFCVGALLCAAFCALLYGALQQKRVRVRRIASAGVLLLCMAELVGNAAVVLPEFEQYPEAAYRTFAQEGAATVQALDTLQEDSVRMEKTFFSSLNDPMTLGYYGLSHFSSARDNRTDALLNALGYGAYGGTVYGRGSTAFADALLGIRYIMSKDAAAVPPHVQRVTAVQTPWPAYENPSALPLAFFVPQAVATTPLPNPSAVDYNTFETQNALFAALSGGEKPLFTPVALTATDAQTGAPSGNEGLFTAAVKYSFTAPADGLYYAALRSAKQNILSFTVPENTGLYFTGEYYGVLNMGHCAAGEQQTMTLQPADAAGMDLQHVFVYYMDQALLAQYAQAARQNAPIVQMNSGSAEIAVDAPEDRLMMTSIPYDEGLVMTLDGAPVPIQRCFDVLCGVQVPAGQHTLRIRYQVPQAQAGAALTLAAGAALAAAYVLGRHRRLAKSTLLKQSSQKGANK